MMAAGYIVLKRAIMGVMQPVRGISAIPDHYSRRIADFNGGAKTKTPLGDDALLAILRHHVAQQFQRLAPSVRFQP
ncbi:hypothetical protein DMB38_25990 [Streptomyces sp. WAC 06738]|nr:hypothetical protein DMB38_25990 [Streptomyces sp. WAC 06738]